MYTARLQLTPSILQSVYFHNVIARNNEKTGFVHKFRTLIYPLTMSAPFLDLPAYSYF